MVKVITTASYYFPSKSGVWLVMFLLVLQCRNPEMFRAGKTSPVYELHVHHAFPGHHVHHLTAGKWQFFCLLNYFKNKKIISCADFPLNLPFLWIIERVLLPPGLPAKEQEPHRAGWDRDERELEPPAAGKCAAGPRSSAVCWGE